MSDERASSPDVADPPRRRHRMTAAGIARYWHTLRWLKPVQFYGRAWFRLHRPRPNLAAAPQLRTPARPWHGARRAASLVGPMQLKLLAVTREIAVAGDWDRPDWPRLWRYNAHYFDDFAADDAADREPWQRQLIERWLADNPPARGSGWEPYPTSLRIVNWIKWSAAGNALPEAARQSLAVQARQLARKLEIHLQGNHLWANAKALVFAGAAHADAEAERWLQRGLALVERELDRQILADGGHFELSPMYHAIVLEDVLDMIQLGAVFPAPWATPARLARWCDIARRMLAWLRVMSHPDGRIAHFNDAAFGIAPAVAALVDYASSLAITADPAPTAALAPLAASGYVRMQAGAATVIADVARIGPDHLPGHAHADTLSFELSLGARRILVNAGTSTYAAGPLRAWQRGTAAHNTVIVDDADSSEVWGSFRVARRARPFAVEWRRDGAALVLAAAHDGYRRLPGRVDHHRQWRLEANRLTVSDRLTGEFGDALARYRFAPGLRIETTGDGGGRILGAERALAWRASGHRAARIVDEFRYPGFGRREPCQVLELALGDTALHFELDWSR